MIPNWIKKHLGNNSAEKFYGDLRQAQQNIESSQRRLRRATEAGLKDKQNLDASHERLKNNLEEMAEKLRRLNRKGN